MLRTNLNNPPQKKAKGIIINEGGSRPSEKRKQDLPPGDKGNQNKHITRKGQAPSSSRATPSSGYDTVPSARVQKLEAQMTTLLQLVRPWMQPPPENEPESAPTSPVDNMMFDALIGDEIPPPSSSRLDGKHPHSSLASDDIEDGRTRKRERQETEAAQKASIIDEELRQQRI
uniref:Integrase core domain containing protein n=1 Tax=Solanum tuberosum TaxID=4113 RepID=M1DDR3_SOLTU